jgi:hypothetical protein
LQGEQPSGSGEQELTRPRIEVDSVLDGKNEVRYSLNLVDDQKAVMADEPSGVSCGSVPYRGVVEVPDAGTWPTVGDQAGKGALARLASAVEHDDPRVAKRCSHTLVRATRIEVASVRHTADDTRRG